MRQGTLFLCFIVITAFLGACSDREIETEAKSKKISVDIMNVKKETVQRALSTMGTIEAEREASLGFKISGKIKEIYCKEGDFVKEGALLAELDITGLLAQKEKARELQDKAKRDLDRLERLYHENSVSLSSLQDARSQYNGLGADIKIIEDNIMNSHIRAPFTGRIDKKYHEPGEIVAAGSPVIIVTDMDPIIVNAFVPDSMIRQIRDAREAVIRVDSYPERVFKGVISRMDVKADPVSRTMGIEILVSNPGEMLRPGLIAKAEISYGNKEERIFIPVDAVIGFGSGPSVFVVEDLKAVKKNIRTGEIIEGRVEVLDGLDPGEMLVISGQEYLDDGREVLIGEQ